MQFDRVSTTRRSSWPRMFLQLMAAGSDRRRRCAVVVATVVVVLVEGTVSQHIASTPVSSRACASHVDKRWVARARKGTVVPGNPAGQSTIALKLSCGHRPPYLKSSITAFSCLAVFEQSALSEPAGVRRIDSSAQAMAASGNTACNSVLMPVAVAVHDSEELP